MFHRCLSKVYREREKKKKKELSFLLYVMPVKVKTDKTVSFTKFLFAQMMEALTLKERTDR